MSASFLRTVGLISAMPVLLLACGGGGGTTPTDGNTSSSSTSSSSGTSSTSSSSTSSSGTTSSSGSSSGGSLGSAAKVVFLHHSTGGYIWGGGVSDWITAYNTANFTNYQVTERTFPSSSYPPPSGGWQNYPYDYWNIWINGGGGGEPTLDDLTADYDVIVWKHCFPVSNIAANTGSPDITSSRQTIENYQAQYNALKDKMHDFPNTRFIVWTGAALVQSATNADEATRARDFANWVKNTWDVDGDNIFVWDFRELETEGGLYLLPANARSANDSHPSDAFSDTAAPLFSQRIVDVIEGRGDTGSLTGH